MLKRCFVLFNFIFTFAAAFAFALNAQAATPSIAIPTNIDYVISGAGPAGLTAALELLNAGADPQNVLVLEARTREGSQDALAEYQSAYGTRMRAILLDQDSVEQLNRLGVRPDASPLLRMRFIHRGQEHLVDNDGVMRNSILHGALARHMDRIVRIGDLENALLSEYLRRGGQIAFGAQITNPQTQGVQTQQSQPSITVNGQNILYQYLFVAEGAGSQTRERAGIGFSELEVPGVRSPNYVGVDFSSNGSDHESKAYMIFNQAGEWEAYGAVASRGGSIGLWTPHPIDLSNPEVARVYRTKIENLLARLGISAEQITKIYTYAGVLRHADRVAVGNTILMGDSLRTTNPEAGNGLNTALKDAAAIGRFYRAHQQENLQNQQTFSAKHDLLLALRENTTRALNQAVQFHSLIRWIAERPTAATLGFSAAAGFGQHPIRNTLGRALELFPTDPLSRSIRSVFRRAGMPVLAARSEDRSIPMNRIHPLHCSSLLVDPSL